jgi:hypothetical protein
MRKMKNSCLRYWFRIFNKKYFKSKFPKKFAVEFAKIHKRRMGITRVEKRGGDLIVGPIRIHKKYRREPSIACMTLLHEMVHAENPSKNGHGKWFNKRMTKLAKDGAFNMWW